MQKAWKLCNRSLRKELVPLPVIKSPDEILVKTRFISLNPIDCRIWQGYGSGVPSFTPTVGHECVGEVERDPCGRLSKTVACFIPPFRSGGALAEYVVVKRNDAVPVPEQIRDDIRSVTCIPYAAATIWRVVEGARGVMAVIGAAGGLGHLAVQMARSNPKISSVVAVCNRRYNDFMKDFGVEAMSSLDVKADHLCILDLVGGPDLSNVRAGSLVYSTSVHPTISAIDQYGMAMGIPLCAAKYLCQKKALTRQFPDNSLQWIFVRSCKEGTVSMLEKIASKELKVFVDRQFPFDEADRGLEYLRTRKKRQGKVIVEV